MQIGKAFKSVMLLIPVGVGWGGGGKGMEGFRQREHVDLSAVLASLYTGMSSIEGTRVQAIFAMPTYWELPR